MLGVVEEALVEEAVAMVVEEAALVRVALVGQGWVVVMGEAVGAVGWVVAESRHCQG